MISKIIQGLIGKIKRKNAFHYFIQCNIIPKMIFHLELIITKLILLKIAIIKLIKHDLISLKALGSKKLFKLLNI